MEVDSACLNCGKSPARFHCGACKTAKYCCKECQAEQWKSGHRLKCAPQKPVIQRAQDDVILPFEIRNGITPNNSRKCFATRTIELGEQIICERASACVPLQNFLNKICVFCCGDLVEKDCFCTGCELAVCSQQCLATFAVFHRFECGVIKSLLVTATAVEVEFSLMMMAMRLLIAQKQPESRPSSAPPIASLTVNAVRATSDEIRSLLDHQEDMEKELQDGIRDTSRVLVTIFPPQISASAEEIQRLICVCLVNCHATGYEDVASGLYPRISMIEHSCLPNAQISTILSPGTLPHLQVRALRKIEAGEEINISYVDLTRRTEERQEQLMREKYFRCTCKRCQQETDPKSDFYMSAYLCTDCKESSLIGPGSRTCVKCHKEYPRQYFDEISRKVTKELERVFSVPQEANRTLQGLEEFVRPRLHPNNELCFRLHQTEEAVYASMRNHRAALDAAREMLRLALLYRPKYYRPTFDCYQTVAFHLFCADSSASSRAEVAQLAQEAEVLLRTVLGKDHPLVSRKISELYQRVPLTGP